jgi:hypothetical protein
MGCMSSSSRKVTVTLPADVLERAMRITGKGLTPTLVEGLRELEKRGKRSALRGLRAKVEVDLDLERTRR